MDPATLELLRDEIETLRARTRDEIGTLKAEVATLKAEHRAAARSSRRRLAAATLAAGLAIAWAATPEARAQFGLTLTGLNARLMAVEAKTAPLSVNGTALTVSGVNVQVVDGTGSTESNSGLGNLTVGYNQSRGPDGTDARTGSHNLILGDLNNYTGSGGMVAGYANTIGGVYATISGGSGNTAGGVYSWVGGGFINSAAGPFSSVSGGYANVAGGFTASVGGGATNSAGGDYASVSGGMSRSAPGVFNWAAGGLSQSQ